MPSKPKQSNSSYNNPEWKFVHTRLTPQEKASVEIWVDDNDSDMLILLSEVLTSGYKVSIKRNVDTDVYYFTLSGNSTTWQNDKCSLSSHHKDLTSAIGIGLYKHFNLSNEGVWRDDPLDDDWG